MQFEFVILDWAAYADGLTQPSEWLAWALGPPVLPAKQVEVVPPLTEMPAMMRRRVDRLGRLACQVAYWCQPSAAQVPMVFASRYGDAARSLSLLGDLVQGQALSPTGFGLSVHNAVSALYSIARGDTQNTVVVAAGRATVEAALVEAMALLADGAPEVLVVVYEAPLPGDYAVFQDEDPCEYAWAWRIALPQLGAERDAVVRVKVRSDALAQAPSAEWSDWPTGLLVLRHVLQNMATPQGAGGPPLVLERACLNA